MTVTQIVLLGIVASCGLSLAFVLGAWWSGAPRGDEGDE